MVERSSLWRRSWPHLRALLVLLHLFAIVLMSLPSSSKLGDRRHWQGPQQQEEMKRWAHRFGVDPQRFESFLWDSAQTYLKVRKSVIRPFLKYADYTGARQGWTMFADPRLQGGRIEVSVELEGQWQLLFRPHSRRYDWNRWKFDHNRMRKVLGRVASSPQDPVLAELTRWIARQVAAEFPNATRAKISVIAWKLQSPQDVRAGVARHEGLSRNQIFTLEDLR